jgi:hypothetical protein
MNQDLIAELSALRMVFNQDTQYLPITEKQIGALNGLLTKGLADKENRIPIIRLLTGIMELDSSKQITMYTATTLIDLLKVSDKKEWELSDYGAWLIESCEEQIEKQPSRYKGGTWSVRSKTQMPDLQEAN